MRTVTVATTQMSCSWNIDENIAKAEGLIYQASAQGAQIVLLQELFETPYFCQQELAKFFNFASTLEENKAVKHFQQIARKLEIVLPISFFEKKNQAHYNSLAVIDITGEILGVYRKSHIPDGPGYEEKYYFNPGDTGFKVFKTKYGTLGIGICWDQWYPETARCLAILGAELLFYPTAIGSEPTNATFDSKNHWQRCMQGHAAANIMPVIAANRVGIEDIEGSQITFYGSSFITDPEGEIIVAADRQKETVLVAKFDLDAIALKRAAWGIFRDRRPDLYSPILTYAGN